MKLENPKTKILIGDNKMNTQKIYNIFCDESRQDLLARQQSINKNNCYCCIGGLMIPLEARNRIKSEIQELQKKIQHIRRIKVGNCFEK